MEERSQIIPIWDDMMQYLKELKDSAKKLSELIKFSAM
jgi:hypothetical protein